jgi:hypothetical protein
MLPTPGIIRKDRLGILNISGTRIVLKSLLIRDNAEPTAG